MARVAQPTRVRRAAPKKPLDLLDARDERRVCGHVDGRLGEHLDLTWNGIPMGSFPLGPISLTAPARAYPVDEYRGELTG